MADSVLPTDWIYAGRDTHEDTQEVTIRDADGALVGEATQIRNVYIFRRYQVVPIPNAMTLPSSSVGTVSSGFIYGYQGGAKVTASAIFTSGTRKWRCISDAHTNAGIGAKWTERHQAWERRDPWEDHIYAEV
jgi:hypothetical protein